MTTDPQKSPGPSSPVPSSTTNPPPPPRTTTPSSSSSTQQPNTKPRPPSPSSAYETFHHPSPTTALSPPALPAPPPPKANTFPGGGGGGGGAREATAWDVIRSIRLQDFREVHTKPCVRDALLVGIGGGFVVGGGRLVFGATTWRAMTYAMTTFCLGSAGTYEFCQRRRALEKAGMARAVEIVERKKVERERGGEEVRRRRVREAEERMEKEKKQKEKEKVEEEERARRKRGWGWA